MGKQAVVSGTGEWATAIARALEIAGCGVATVETTEDLPAAAAGFAPASIDAYVQLSKPLPTRGGSVTARMRNFLADGLLARFDALDAVLPALAPGAAVVLVSGNKPQEHLQADDHRARIALLKVLANAARADGHDRDVRVVVIAPDTPAEEVAALVAHGPRPAPSAAELSEFRPDLDYADWRLEVMSRQQMEA